ncbi:MAG: flavin reductase [Candidatus Marinamargulisbacteria bacterium]|nr:flavin oxidoreductase [bacterium]MDG2265123.1 flavin reductase [Candidatus Marinamargulisbacteria bacterium]
MTLPPNTVTLGESDIAAMDGRYQVNFINSLSGFKSGNLVGTVDGKGHENLTLVSSAVHIGSNPPTLGVVFRPSIVPRHGYENIINTRFFTLNHIGESFFKAAHQTSARYPKTVSEFNEAHLTSEYLNNFSAPYVQESQFKLGLEFAEVHHTHVNPTHIVIAHIRWVHMAKNCIQPNGSIDLSHLGTMAISGLDHYHTVNPGTKMPYAKA